MRENASYSYEGLVVTAIEPCAADCDGVSAIGFVVPFKHASSRIQTYGTSSERLLELRHALTNSATTAVYIVFICRTPNCLRPITQPFKHGSSQETKKCMPRPKMHLLSIY